MTYADNHSNRVGRERGFSDLVVYVDESGANRYPKD